MRVLLVTGGHDFDRPAFFAMWDGFEGMEYREAVHPQAREEFAPERAASYDVVVLYDMNQEISEGERADFLKLLESGKGLVVMHHALGSYQTWEGYRKLVGGLYLLSAAKVDDRDYPASTYDHDLDLAVRVADREHPITQGVEDFTIHDEAYGGLYLAPTIHPLLTTDHPKSSPTVAWTNSYGQSRIACLQLGHDARAYADPNLRRLLRQAILWASGRG